MKNKIDDSNFFWNITVEFLNDYLPNIRRSSNNTVETYKNCLNRYIDYLEVEKKIKRKLICFKMFDKKHIREYLVWMSKEKNLSPKTCNLRLTAINSLLQYVSNEYFELMAIYMESSSVKGLKIHNKPIEYFEPEVLSTLFKAAVISKKSERRNLMLLIFLYDTAARITEALNVRLCDLHMDANVPHVTLLGKGKKYRNLPLMDKTLEHLKHYINEFHESNCPGDTPLFYATTHGIKHKLSKDTPEKMIKRYAQIAGQSCTSMPENVHCHMIRKTRAMNLYQSGIPLTHIQQLLGHESISTTSGFYAFATLDTLTKSLEKVNTTVFEKSWKDKEIKERLYRL